MTLYRFDSLESTNKYCEVLDPQRVEDFSCFWAIEQRSGIGQRGNRWVSDAGANLTFSLYLKPPHLLASDQFRLTQMLSLSITDTIEAIVAPHTVYIKWPNDIYISDSKVCGILVSNRIVGSRLINSICGIGLNVNQTVFPDWIPNPTSLSQATGRNLDCEEMLHLLLSNAQRRYAQLNANHDMSQEYLDKLYLLGEPANYLYNAQPLRATITGVDRFGHLLLTSDSGKHLSCGIKEIVFLPKEHSV